MIVFDQQRHYDQAAIDTLLDQCFGPHRHAKTAQRLRDGRRPADGLALLARQDGAVRATLSFWHVVIGARHRALLLGPIAVDPALQGSGLGAALINHGLTEARHRGHKAVLLIGDAPYYRRFGFDPALTHHLRLPGPVDPARFLGLELTPGALSGARGLVRAAGHMAPRRQRPGAAAPERPLRARRAA